MLSNTNNSFFSNAKSLLSNKINKVSKYRNEWKKLKGLVENEKVKAIFATPL